jgi:hypothetical protein
MEGFAQGMDSRASTVEDAAKRALAGVAGNLPTDFSAKVSASQVGAATASSFGSAGGGTTTNTTHATEVNINVPLEDLKSITDVQDLLDFIDRLRNDSRRGMEVPA